MKVFLGMVMGVVLSLIMINNFNFIEDVLTTKKENLKRNFLIKQTILILLMVISTVMLLCLLKYK
jgi:hypothetical protein